MPQARGGILQPQQDGITLVGQLEASHDISAGGPPPNQCPIQSLHRFLLEFPQPGPGVVGDKVIAAAYRAFHPLMGGMGL